ncbi:hypothetical protein BLNAU_14342 [Blattamonas nauphoetae]|uniref:Uncharacterized protein n=1 Tax=Blattamonas nauphoetae TaxID=2049346 RepID=A0ABQ9XFF1_9EUKA|nr:hypothetical protein BLNAU_14342 [Blattamonas nauphoetae]
MDGWNVDARCGGGRVSRSPGCKEVENGDVQVPRTRLSDRSFFPTLPPLSSFFVSDGVVSETNCSAFLNWDEESLQSFHEAAVVFWSLVATVKLQPVLDDTLEGKAVNFLQRMDLDERELADAFLMSLRQTMNESSRDFIQSISVLLSSPSQAVTTATMKMLQSLIANCSRKVRLALVKADLIPQLITTLNPQSLSFTEALDIHTSLMINITNTLGLATPNGLGQLGIEDDNEQEAEHETVLQQVLAPSEKYIWHLCMNRFSIVDGNQSANFLEILAKILQISHAYQPTMNFVLNMPVFLTLPSCLTFFEDDCSIWYFLDTIIDAQLEWNKRRGEERKMGKTVLRMLRMEGFEDAMEEKLQNDKSETDRVLIVSLSMELTNLHGINLPWR